MKKIYLCLFLIIGLISGCTSSSVNDPKNVIESYFKCYEMNNFSNYQNLWMDEAYKGKPIEGDIYESIQIKEIEIVDENEDSMEVAVDFEVIYKENKFSVWNNGNNHLTFILKKDGKQWKISSIGNA